eukprot:48220-Prorocentrum_minimum.AAC.1
MSSRSSRARRAPIARSPKVTKSARLSAGGDVVPVDGLVALPVANRANLALKRPKVYKATEHAPTWWRCCPSRRARAPRSP